MIKSLHTRRRVFVNVCVWAIERLKWAEIERWSSVMCTWEMKVLQSEPKTNKQSSPVTRKMEGTCRGQRSLRCCNWLFLEWDPQPSVTCPMGWKTELCKSDMLWVSDCFCDSCYNRQSTVSAAESFCRNQHKRRMRVFIWDLTGMISYRLDSQRYLKDLRLVGLRVGVRISALLAVVLTLPLGPDLWGATLKLPSALTAFSWNIWRKWEHENSFTYTVKAQCK